MRQRLSKMVSAEPGVKLTQVHEKQPRKEDLYIPDFVEAYQKDEDARRIIDTALSIEGLTRGEGVHACAVLICRDAVNEHVPTKLDTKCGVEITQYEGHTVADMGLLNMDFDDERRLEVIEHVRQLYGPEKVTHVSTYSTIKAKQAINDAARVLDYPV